MNSEGQAECCISQVLVRVLQINRTNNREREREMEKTTNNLAQGSQAGFLSYYQKLVFYSTQTLN